MITITKKSILPKEVTEIKENFLFSDEVNIEGSFRGKLVSSDPVFANRRNEKQYIIDRDFSNGIFISWVSKSDDKYLLAYEELKEEDLLYLKQKLAKDTE